MVVFRRMSLLLRVVMLVEHAWTVDQKVVESSFRNTQNIEAELGTDGEHTLVGSSFVYVYTVTTSTTKKMA